MQELFNEIVIWQDATFPKSNALSKYHHLFDEVIELGNVLDYESENNCIVIEDTELADCIILLFGIAHKRGMSFSDLQSIIELKMEVNKKRKWGKPDENGVVNHVEN